MSNIFNFLLHHLWAITEIIDHFKPKSIWASIIDPKLIKITLVWTSPVVSFFEGSYYYLKYNDKYIMTIMIAIYWLFLFYILMIYVCSLLCITLPYMYPCMKMITTKNIHRRMQRFLGLFEGSEQKNNFKKDNKF